LLADQLTEEAVALVQRLIVGDLVQELLLVLDRPLRHSQARLQFVDMKRLGDVIIRSGVEGGRDIVAVRLRAEHEDIRTGLQLGRTQGPADRQTIGAREHPIEHDDRWRVLGLCQFEDLASVGVDDRRVARTRQKKLHHFLSGGFVVDNKYTHFGGLSGGEGIERARSRRLNPSARGMLRSNARMKRVFPASHDGKLTNSFE
jgi:hypothetical protein